MEEVKFYQCKECKTVLLEIAGLTPNCCSKDMELITANTVEAAQEKHIPILTYEDGILSVKVGSVEHPMTPDHYIAWIFVQTKNGGLYKYLTPENSPTAQFSVTEDDIENVYAYCNLHGLWKAEPLLYDFSETVCSPEFPEGCKDSNF